MTAQLATLIQTAIGSDYRVDQELDGGGMSRLFLATDLRHNRRVVVKVLTPELMTEQSTARFKREIELTVRLQHPHILPILTSGAWEDTLYYITPFIPGESLKARIARDGKLPLDDIVKILRDVSGALAFAHSRGIVHRDIKPGNILLAEGHAILADFGIARAVGTTATPLTVSGMVPGTPAYMAPELPTDEKADVYALGIVAYEMLCGGLPSRGVTPRDIVTARGRIAGDSRLQLGRLAELVWHATTLDAVQRIHTSREFAETLDSESGTKGVPFWRTALLVAAAAIIAAVLSTWVIRHRDSLSPSSFAIASLNSDSLGVVQRLAEAVAEWRGAAVVDPVDFAAAVHQGGRARATLADMKSTARSKHAGNLVIVDARREGDSTLVAATLYDIQGDSSVRTRRVAFANGAVAVIAPWRRLANGMVRVGDELPWTRVPDEAAPSLAAWRAYDDGRAEIERWSLPQAETRFRDAIQIEPRMALAQLWLAQTLAWSARADQVPEVRAFVQRALDQHRGMSERDSLHAAGLLGLATRRYPEACAAFGKLTALDSSRVVGWIGAGDCQANDHGVIRDAKSPTGWAYRASYEFAAKAYQRAAETGPVADAGRFQGWVLGRLSSVLYPVTNYLRLGVSTGPDSARFAAYPILDHDTLAFYPVSFAEISGNTDEQNRRLTQAAVGRNRLLMLRAAEEWVRRSPKVAAAYDSLATWVEVSGTSAQLGEQRATAIDVVKRALQLATDSTERVHLGVSEVRLLLKQSQFHEARVAAESLLAGGAGSQATRVQGVAGLAAILGRIDETVALLAKDPENSKIPTERFGTFNLSPQLAEMNARVTALSWFEVNPDSAAVAARRLSEVIASYYPDTAVAAELRNSMLDRPAAVLAARGVSLWDVVGASRDRTVVLARELSRATDADVRHDLERLQGHDVGKTRGAAVEIDYLRARIAMRVRDTSAAIRELDPTLRALPTIAPSVLAQVPQAVSLVNALALRASIARSRGDRAVAVQCAAAVIELWQHADLRLQPVVAEMKSILNTPA